MVHLQKLQISIHHLNPKQPPRSIFPFQTLRSTQIDLNLTPSALIFPIKLSYLLHSHPFKVFFQKLQSLFSIHTLVVVTVVEGVGQVVVSKYPEGNE